MMIVHNIPSEIWLHIGQQVTQQRQYTLRSLSETCRFFHNIYTPLLFSSLRVTSFEKIVSSGFADFAATSSLLHVQRFKVIAGPGYAESFAPNQEALLYEAFNRNLIDCLKSMPNLVSFTLGLPGPWKTIEEENDGVNSVPLFHEVLRTLQAASPKLRRLTLCVGSIPSEDDEYNGWMGFIQDLDIQPFVQFRNLTSLVLVGQFTFPASIDSLVSTLLASPKLTILSLDLEGVPLSRVCNAYADSGGQPFALRHLRFSVFKERFRNGWSSLRKLATFQKLQSVELDIGYSWDDKDTYTPASREPIYQAIADPAKFTSLRCLSVNRLDDSLLTVIRKVGQSPDFPPFFLSELFFEVFDWDSAIKKGGFSIHPEKRLYWPTCFVLGQNIGYPSTSEFRLGLVREISGWQGLQLLHLSLDMEKDRTHLVTLTDSLCTNLSELYITNEHSPRGESSIDDDPEYGSELAFAGRLCAKSRISYLVVYDTGYRVVRRVGEDTRLEVVGAGTESDEAEIFTLFRERRERLD